MLPERFTDKILHLSDGCWQWTAALERGGYGSYYHDGRMQRAHRVAYQLLVGVIPDGLQIDHLCRVRSCVNPEHMEPVTSAENVRRGSAAERHTHCKRGHELSGWNSIRSNDNRQRCRICTNAGQRRRYRQEAHVA